MFTKYTNINVPKNYSGSRFKPGAEDTEMKTHRAQDYPQPISKIKTSVSPKFQEVLDEAVRQDSDVAPACVADGDCTNSTDCQINDCVDCDIQDAHDVCQSISSDAESTLREADNCRASRSPLLGELSRFFENVKNDDLILVALIILLAKDSTADSLDAIVILALLLLYH